MRPARVRMVLALAAGCTAVVWLLLDFWISTGGNEMPLPWTSVAGTAALAIAVVAAGLPVRRWVRGRRDKPLDALVAARTVVLAKSGAYGGALLAGWYAAQGLELLPDVQGARRTRLILASLGVLTAVAVTVSGLIVQHWCRVPPGTTDDQGPDDDRSGIS